jgi:hypothetical protein
MKTMQADLDKAHAMVCKQYAQHRAEGETASSPYAYFLMFQASNRQTLKRQGRGDFELWELAIIRDDGTSTIVDLRNLAPDVFGEPNDSQS